MSNERIKEILRDYVIYDSASADIDYIRSVLTDICKCSDEELDDIGLGWLILEE